MSLPVVPPPSASSPERLARPRVLVVDDEESLRHLLRVILGRLSYEVLDAADGRSALELLHREPDVRVVLCDIRMPRMDGLSFLEAVRGRGLRVVMMSAFGTTETAVEALSRGAWDYISKPFRAEEIRICLERLLERDRLEQENRLLWESVGSGPELDGFIGQSEPARQVKSVVRKVAAYPSTVLVTGESGTGKELVARALHACSPRARRPMVAVNCAAIPESLLESELFGHARGAFTGAVRDHAGLFEQAHTSTLLLDEIGDMPLPLQTRLLRVLEDGRVRRVGGRRDIEVDVRVVSSTAKDLAAAVKQGRFREDLFYRLNVVHLHLPPLRERREDIPELARAFVERAAARLGAERISVGRGALRLLTSYDWPGNVRQLENAIERAVLMAAGEELRPEDLPVEIRAAVAAAPTPPSLAEVDPDEDLSIKRRVASLERELIERALIRTQGNKSAAARLLDLSYKALLYKIRDYGLEEA